MTSTALIFNRPVSYRRAVALQESLVEARLADAVPDLALLLEHPPVVTLGRRARDEHLVVSRAALAEQGIELNVAARGGDVTYHGPGQAVVYPILKLGAREADAHGYLHNLEETAVRTAADFGVQAFRRKGMSGAWTDQGKIAAIGFRLRRWVSFHGMSFNVTVDLNGFDTIVPCGLAGEQVASLKTLLGADCPEMNQVQAALARNLSQVMSRSFQSVPAASYRGEPLIEEALARCLDPESHIP